MRRKIIIVIVVVVLVIVATITFFVIKDLQQEKSLRKEIDEIQKEMVDFEQIIYVFLTIFLYLLKCPQILIL